jgi:hypothetical protein
MSGHHLQCWTPSQRVIGLVRSIMYDDPLLCSLASHLPSVLISPHGPILAHILLLVELHFSPCSVTRLRRPLFIDRSPPRPRRKYLSLSSIHDGFCFVHGQPRISGPPSPTSHALAIPSTSTIIRSGRPWSEHRNFETIRSISRAKSPSWAL